MNRVNTVALGNDKSYEQSSQFNESIISLVVSKTEKCLNIGIGVQNAKIN